MYCRALRFCVEGMFVVSVLRWILVVPAAVVGVLLGSLSTMLGILVGGFLIGLPGSGPWGIVLTIIFIAPLVGFIFGCLAAGGAIPVYGAAVVAPRHRGVVSIVAATLVIALTVIGTVSGIARGTTDLPALLVGLITAGGAVYGAVQMRGADAPSQVAVSPAMGSSG
jgi:hypothetical protein